MSCKKVSLILISVFLLMFCLIGTAGALDVAKFVNKWTGLTDVSRLTVDAAGNTYAITYNHTVVKISPDGKVTTVSSKGSYYDPPLYSGIVVDATGNLYLMDYYYRSIEKIASNGLSQKKWNINVAEPLDLVADKSGNLYALDGGHGTDYRPKVIKYNSNGQTLAEWKNNLFVSPTALAIDKSGFLYVADGKKIYKLDTTGKIVATFASSGLGAFNTPRGLAVDGSGNIYISSGELMYGCYIVKLDSKGAYKARWGGAGIVNSNFKDNCGIAVDTAGKVL